MLLATSCLIHLPEWDYELFCLTANILSPPGDPKACSLLGPGLHSESGWDSHPSPAPLTPFLTLIYPLESFCKRRSRGSGGIGPQGYNEFIPCGACEGCMTWAGYLTPLCLSFLLRKKMEIALFQ